MKHWASKKLRFSDKTVMSDPDSLNSSADGAIVCPYCGDTADALMPIEPGMRLRLNKDAQLSSVPDSVCDGCFKMLNKMSSKGATLRSEQQAREQNRLTLWRNRVQLVKQGKAHLAKKNFSEAAVAYEKYIRVLELVYDAKPGELSPELFKDKTRSHELTVIATVYWDLLRIYDTQSAYKDRQYKAAQKLAEFVRYTPIFPQIIRKAETQARVGKNPDAFNKFLILSHAKRPRCFIATAAFSDQEAYGHPVILTLCHFRDHYLRKTSAGRAFIYLYYRLSPKVAATLDQYPALKPSIRAVLTRIANSQFIRNRLNH
jgi:hypothetical protein